MKGKKWISMLLCLMLPAAISGCGGSGTLRSRITSGQVGVEDVLQAGIAEADGNAGVKAAGTEAGGDAETEAVRIEAGGNAGAGAAGTEAQTEGFRQSGLLDNAQEPMDEADGDIALSTTEGIDVDLTSLSSTIVYSEVYDMMNEPENYIGKTIKMDGIFAVYHNESSGNYYFACIIQDATACCAQGIEFTLAGDHAYPDDYPEEGGWVTVVGVFDTYMEGEYMYYTLRDAAIV